MIMFLKRTAHVNDESNFSPFEKDLSICRFNHCNFSNQFSTLEFTLHGHNITPNGVHLNNLSANPKHKTQNETDS